MRFSEMLMVDSHVNSVPSVASCRAAQPWQWQHSDMTGPQPGAVAVCPVSPRRRGSPPRLAELGEAGGAAPSPLALSLQVHIPGLPLHPLLAAVHLLLRRRHRGQHRTAAGDGTWGRGLLPALAS